MRNFLKNIGTFTILYFGIILIVIFSLRILVNNSKYYKLDSEISTIILGHSHAECGVNDQLMSGTMNLAQSGEVYFYSYLKLKKLLDENPNIKRVLLEFSNNQISLESESGLWSYKYLNYRYPKYSNLIGVRGNLEILFYGEGSYLSLLSLSIQEQFKFLESDKPAFDFFDWGGYLKLDQKLHIQRKWESWKSQLYLIPSSRSINDFFRILDFCLENNIEIIVFRSPQHRTYPGRINEQLFQYYIEELRIRNINFLDFANLDIPDSCFADSGHLNEYGASIFTNELKEQIQ